MLLPLRTSVPVPILVKLFTTADVRLPEKIVLALFSPTLSARGLSLARVVAPGPDSPPRVAPLRPLKYIVPAPLVFSVLFCRPLALVIASVPPLTIVGPPYVLAAVSVKVPLPVLVRPPA